MGFPLRSENEHRRIAYQPPALEALAVWRRGVDPHPARLRLRFAGSSTRRSSDLDEHVVGVRGFAAAAARGLRLDLALFLPLVALVADAGECPLDRGLRLVQ